MNKANLVGELMVAEQFFNRGTGVLTEEDAGFRPTPECFSVAEQFAHVAITVDWFVEALKGRGFDMDFDEHLRQARGVTGLAEARAMVAASFAGAAAAVEALSEAELAEPLPKTGIMDGLPRFCVVGAVADHTAHHRGSLAVYARLVGKEPAMPYA